MDEYSLLSCFSTFFSNIVKYTDSNSPFLGCFLLTLHIEGIYIDRRYNTSSIDIGNIVVMCDVKLIWTKGLAKVIKVSLITCAINLFYFIRSLFKYGQGIRPGTYTNISFSTYDVSIKKEVTSLKSVTQ